MARIPTNGPVPLSKRERLAQLRGLYEQPPKGEDMATDFHKIDSYLDSITREQGIGYIANYVAEHNNNKRAWVIYNALSKLDVPRPWNAEKIQAALSLDESLLTNLKRIDPEMFKDE